MHGFFYNKNKKVTKFFWDISENLEIIDTHNPGFCYIQKTYILFRISPFSSQIRLAVDNKLDYA